MTCDFEHPHDEHPCGERVSVITGDSLRGFLYDSRPAADLTDRQIDDVVKEFRKFGIDSR